MAKVLVFVAIFLSLLSLASGISYVNITADNTFELFVDGVGLVTPLCADNSTYRSKYEAPNNGTGMASNCFWGEPTRIPAIQLSSGSVVAIHGRNALGNNTNPLLGGMNPGAFILTVTGQNNDVCASSDVTSKWTCADNLQLLQYTGSPYPPAEWSTANYQPPSWWGGPLDDLGVNGPNAWVNLTTKAQAGSWPNSVWYNTIPLGPMSVPGVDVNAHWVWYRYNIPNTDIYCRLKIAPSFNCSVKSSSPSTTASLSSSVTPTISLTRTASATSPPSNTASTTSSSSNTASATSSSSPSPSPSCPECYFWSSELGSCRPINESLDFDPSNNTCAVVVVAAGDGGGNNNAGAIAGGVVGGVAALAAVAGLAAAGVVAAVILKKRAVAPVGTGSAFSGSSGLSLGNNPAYAPSANAPQDNPIYSMGS